MQFKATSHAIERMRARNIRAEQVSFALENPSVTWPSGKGRNSTCLQCEIDNRQLVVVFVGPPPPGDGAIIKTTYWKGEDDD